MSENWPQSARIRGQAFGSNVHNRESNDSIESAVSETRRMAIAIEAWEANQAQTECYECESFASSMTRTSDVVEGGRAILYVKKVYDWAKVKEFVKSPC